ncbi:bile acid:Na+ symporter, BASS family/solute carrier family 10 (sodium/bile acid cotransporter), member 7 [Halobiforma haloterrestris]|uniref:Bile acid:Na+ symporter, BASS family/solute carrier family 10 (Sodium/bile acid cotransporter), member 7 n=1 Tax=Natronobacterium haloterrestre TaxID=148448 RepID=A0A1I1J1M2_NATHA|nr:bile acid:sodium symporter [Halobiforma haloterrestris]SFC42366.1 bile acid:Na+ symporter, BASS family/solute carrier family 10 (sodium/bile acid cotransporter), member 7 [Halobiforma haloterrestris]
MVSLRQTVKSQQSLLVVVAATVAGVAFPTLASPLQPTIPALVVGLVFTAFYGFEFADVGLEMRRLSTPILVSLASVYVLVPLVLYPVATVALSGELLLGVLVVLSAPVAAGSSIVWTRLSGGNTLLSTVIVLASMLLAPLVMPAIISVLGDSAADIAAGELFLELGAIVVIAAVFAVLVPGGTVSDRQLDGFSVATMGALIYVGVGGSTLSIAPSSLAFVVGIAVAALGLSVGLAYALSARGYHDDDCISVLFSSSMKNLSVAVMVGAMFGGGAIIAAITAFHVTQQLVSSSLVRRLAASPAETSEALPASQPGD